MPHCLCFDDITCHTLSQFVSVQSNMLTPCAWGLGYLQVKETTRAPCSPQQSQVIRVRKHCNFFPVYRLQSYFRSATHEARIESLFTCNYVHDFISHVTQRFISKRWERNISELMKDALVNSLLPAGNLGPMVKKKRKTKRLSPWHLAKLNPILNYLPASILPHPRHIPEH